MAQRSLERTCKGVSSVSAITTYNPLTIQDNYEVDPIQGDYKDLRPVMGHCPCPKISAPIFAAGFVVFSPL